MCEKAAKNGWLDLIQLVVDSGSSYDLVKIASNAAAWGHIKILQWAQEQGITWEASIFAEAIYSQNKQVIAWLLENKCPWDELSCKYAARKSNLTQLKWLRDNGCPWDERTCESAADYRNLQILQWARENGCPWDESTTDAAVYNKDNKTLNWALENGCPFTEKTLKYLLDTKEYEKFQHFLEAYQDVPSEKIIKKVIKKGNLDIIKLLHEKNAIFPDNGLQIAAKHGHLELVKWFLSLILDKTLENAVDSGNMELVGWLKETYGHTKI